MFYYFAPYMNPSCRQYSFSPYLLMADWKNQGGHSNWWPSNHGTIFSTISNNHYLSMSICDDAHVSSVSHIQKGQTHSLLFIFDPLSTAARVWPVNLDDLLLFRRTFVCVSDCPNFHTRQLLIRSKFKVRIWYQKEDNFRFPLLCLYLLLVYRWRR